MHRTGTTRHTYTLDEHHLYGASRLGMEVYDNVKLADVQVLTHPVFGTIVTAFPVTVNDEFAEERELKMKRYELNSHQSSVHITVSDRKLSVEGAPGQTAHYLPDVVFYGDYYSAGMLKNGRHGQETNIKTRYKHQGQEGDDEINGEGNSYAYEYRMSDPRTVRFWSLDPLSAKYPYNSPYAFSENILIHAIELEGLERRVVISVKYREYNDNEKLINITDYKVILTTIDVVQRVHAEAILNIFGGTLPGEEYLGTQEVKIEFDNRGNNEFQTQYTSSKTEFTDWLNGLNKGEDIGSGILVLGSGSGERNEKKKVWKTIDLGSFLEIMNNLVTTKRTPGGRNLQKSKRYSSDEFERIAEEIQFEPERNQKMKTEGIQEWFGPHKKKQGDSVLYKVYQADTVVKEAKQLSPTLRVWTGDIDKNTHEKKIVKNK
jgi:hypothetical protein